MVLDKLKVKNAPATFAPMAAAHNRLVKVLQAMIGINGIKVSMTEANIFIEFTGVVGTGASGPHPFKVEKAGAGLIRVVFGQVNSITPTIGGTEIDDAAVPSLSVATGVVYLALVLDGAGAITSASIHNDTALPASDATHGYITLATVVVSGGTTINQSVTNSLQFLRCNGQDVFGAV